MKLKFTRRKFLFTLGGICFSDWLARELLVENNSLPGPSNPLRNDEGIAHLNLVTGKSSRLTRFYQDILGFKVQTKIKEIRIFSGSTTINFKDSTDYAKPIYHIAWGIPSSKFSKAKEWLSNRVDLLKHRDGRDEFHFDRINRKAIYFADPAGNVLELIARYNIADMSTGDFTVEDIQYVNHVGLVVDHVGDSLNRIKSVLGMNILDRPTTNFGKIGNENRHLVLVTRGRYWLPEHIHPANVFPLEVSLSGLNEKDFTLEKYPYRINMHKSISVE